MVDNTANTNYNYSRSIFSEMNIDCLLVYRLLSLVLKSNWFCKTPRYTLRNCYIDELYDSISNKTLNCRVYDQFLDS